MPGSIRLFRLLGIDVFLHWSWLLVALFQVNRGQAMYGSVFWSALEYIALFAIVTMHEFGHALACRSVGGRAERIMLWPLGGVAYVQPPPRAGAQLWSIIAGPLVNLVLIAPLYFLYITFQNQPGNIGLFFKWINIINIALLIFNMLPLYPLDGGQVLRSVLWFFVGPKTSLKIASIIGLIGAGIGAALALMTGSIWLIIMAAFAGMQSYAGFKRASMPVMEEEIPFHTDYQCPSCNNSPPALEIWRCDHCGVMFDTFATDFQCPSCNKQFETTGCPHCRQVVPKEAWIRT